MLKNKNHKSVQVLVELMMITLIIALDVIIELNPDTGCILCTIE